MQTIDCLCHNLATRVPPKVTFCQHIVISRHVCPHVRNHQFCKFDEVPVLFFFQCLKHSLCERFLLLKIVTQMFIRHRSTLNSGLDSRFFGGPSLRFCSKEWPSRFICPVNERAWIISKYFYSVCISLILNITNC